MRNDFDPFQATIIVIALVAGFLKWLWENWQQSREAAKRDLPVDPDEQRRREAIWRRQTRQDKQPPPMPSPPPPVAPSPWDELRKAWKELQETAKQAQMPPRPAPAPQRPKSAAVRPRPIAAVVSAPVPPVLAPPEEIRSSAADSMLTTLHQLRRDPALMRQAILMHAVLGPPKALQSSGGPAI